jgi:sucrose-6-phosphate hydrolase SacC (GH32 family)
MSSIYNSYVAISDDGLSWTRYSGNPVLTATEAWEGSSVLPGSVTQDGSLLKMAYANASLSAIGFATSTDGLHWTKDSSNPIFSNSGTANKWTNTLHYPCLRKLGNEWRIYYCGFVGSVKQIGVLRKI